MRLKNQAFDIFGYTIKNSNTHPYMYMQFTYVPGILKKSRRSGCLWLLELTFIVLVNIMYVFFTWLQRCTTRFLNKGSQESRAVLPVIERMHFLC